MSKYSSRYIAEALQFQKQSNTMKVLPSCRRAIMKVTSKGQVTIPQKVREMMGIRPAETEVEFLQDENGRWYLNKTCRKNNKPSRFRIAHKAGKLRMTTDEIMALTRGE